MSIKEKIDSLMFIDADNKFNKEMEGFSISDMVIFIPFLLTHPFHIFMDQIKFITNDRRTEN